MHFQFLIEDQSSTALIEILMKKISLNRDNVTFNCKSFKGIGGYIRKNIAKEIKSGKLLNDLPQYMRGLDKSLKDFPAVIFVVVDNDDRDTKVFLDELEQIAEINRITVDHVFCIAVEEVEAWLLGDEDAIVKAYPYAKLSALCAYEQDSICGTWEVLADVVYQGGVSQLKKDCTTYFEIGKYKKKWAENIGIHMDVTRNNSPSFQYFMREINKRLSASI